ncbi:MAG: anhydro-N-acetylmuramic acid kinase [Candidatus Omnitrophica bacterium]|nr:anhydro-N-acetylmuramic acid kinase [Candidatus Omnitrophota bacterium]
MSTEYQRLHEQKPSAPVLGVGLMSGTSMDAVDSALVAISPAERPPVRLIEYVETPIPTALQRRLREAMHPERSNIEQICQLNFEVGALFADAVHALVEKAHIDPSALSFIGSHGQTLYHIPSIDAQRNWETPSTLQIGDPCVIAEKTGVLTVGDFRVRDMAAGGIGAPLMPFVDAFLFAQTDRSVLCQNIGGIANCTLISPAREILAFDSGPGNMVMDAIVQKAFTGKQYDANGELARKGEVIPSLLADCLQHPFIKKAPPKATGHEDFGEGFTRRFMREGKDSPIEDLLATACELTARSIIDAYQDYVFPCGRPEEVIVSGGGTKNVYLMERLRELSPELTWRKSDEHGIPSSAKEAIGFAVLGYATLCGIPANIPSATGAGKSVVLGKIAPGAAFSRTSFFL